MIELPILEAAAILDARVVGSAEGDFEGVCTDTRVGAEGALFFALRGENADGHRYVAQAFRQGARAAVVEREVPEAGGPQLVVPDALNALGSLAGAWRRRLPIPVVGITGSVGKTSTREMIACALSGRLSVLTNQANFNTEIGVPLTLFGLHAGHQAAVIEMAMRGAGQIAQLAEIAGPTAAVITNVGLSHVELLGSREAIADAKGELIDYLPADAPAILNADDDFVEHLAARARQRGCAVVTFGVSRPADFQATDLRFDEDGQPAFTVRGVALHVPSPGGHHVGNAAAACAVASTLGVSLEEAAAQLAAYHAPAMRMQTLHAPGDVTVLNDAYNAAPDSMRAALDTLALLAGRAHRAVAVLGDMRELGDRSEEAHRYVGEMVARVRPGLLVTVGQAARTIGETAAPALGTGAVLAFDDTEAAARALPALARPGDVVLVKGSRALEMERIVAALLGIDVADLGH